MNREIKLNERLYDEPRGAFVKGMTVFLITDNLQVVPMSTSATLSLFAKYDIRDGSNIQEFYFEFGAAEAIGNQFCS